MLIAAGALFQFVKFMQITLFIMLPVIVAVAGWTIFIHYRRRKKPVTVISGTEAIQRLASATPEMIDVPAEDADYIHYDHTALIREYKRKLIYSHARFTALKQDHSRLQDHCNMLMSQVKLPLTQTKNNHSMESINSREHAGPENLLAAMAVLEDEKKQLQEKLELVNQSFLDLEKENNALTGQVEWLTSQGDAKVNVDNRWQQENVRLQEQVAEQDYLRDVVEEKKTQILFLQEQLEQRIRNYHQAERQATDLRVQLESANARTSDITAKMYALSDELKSKNDQVQNLQQQLGEKENLIIEKESNITWLENTLRETKQQNEMLNAMLADSKDLVDTLQNTVADEQTRILQLEQKFDSNRQLLRKIYRDLAGFEEGESPVIELKPMLVSG